MKNRIIVYIIGNKKFVMVSCMNKFKEILRDGRLDKRGMFVKWIHQPLEWKWCLEIGGLVGWENVEGQD